MGSFTALLAYSVSFATISAIAQLTWTQTETFFRRRGELVVLQKSRAASAASASQLPDSQPDPSPASPPVRLVDVRYKVADPTSGALLDATSIGDAISAWMAERFQPPEWAYVNKVLEKEQKLEEEIVRVEERVQRLRQEMERREGLKTP
ncbi:hypothetical protein M427DRAFT_139671 [Gonapodya prolifera JEL478]|uniref:Uncharacterized protein n=1 Tax=Gonapodya prolifera (strain JEL478) TaxID=1344416 RepID=A0A139A0L7_GONPJ|nr:hypothetical protein M427DRAFT_139671 [Gonapodya prolifera JEL478]|eukprot:KXS10327.1 hypothetical protein M427DRAFT_139671 [Gonapodya prolifera JEL478]